MLDITKFQDILIIKKSWKFYVFHLYYIWQVDF